ncbi:hypothetical protein LOD99_3969 [Oopsacas minuta]|uniref:Uncharacterized protein n=1 Tax=Oopsacas minuta TaxID=111878 RepID=A0AAV7JVZ9_9METZ|nr:hypothetical protein LOD99_3969 [Oopsacas minuta]
MCDRYQISDRAGAAIANAVLQDYGIITPEEDGQIIDRNKLRRSRFSVRKELANEAHQTINDISAIYFDGRADGARVNTRIYNGDNDEQIRQNAVKIILDIRMNSSSFRPIEIRPFNLPSIRFTAETYADIIDWVASFITKPPFTEYISKEILIYSVRTPLEIAACLHAIHKQLKELFN